MDTASLPGFLRAMQRTAGGAAVRAAADAMAEGAAAQISDFTLRRTQHPPGMFWRAARGAAPAYASGRLAASVRPTPAVGGGGQATAWAGAYARYAGIQEFGGRTWPRHAAYMHWVNSRGSWYKKMVRIPEHPYFRPTVESLERNGELRRWAAEAFHREMSRYYG